ncbi:hypothetical protein ACNI3Q_10325 [Sphingomonas sp. FW199]|uniref:hypothetical protein n=1 Tax=Sphingomonas sp. FW199 TaxID=3400217 RepID=UPI003CE77192
MMQHRSVRRLGAAGAIAGLGLAIVLAMPMLTDDPPPGEMTAPVAPPAVRPIVEGSEPVDAPTALLLPPQAPAIRDAMPASPARLYGRWVGDGQVLTIAPLSGAAFAVTVKRDGAEQTYDATMRDGRLQVTMGIDSEWLQLAGGDGDRPCLMLGTRQRFCRAE